MQKIDFSKAFTSNGGLSLDLLFVEAIGIAPSIVYFEYDDKKLDLKKITHPLISDIFPDNRFIRLSDVFSSIKTSAVQDENENEDQDDFYSNEMWVDKSLIILCTDILWSIQYKRITIYYHPRYTLNQINDLYNKAYSQLPKLEERSKAAQVKLVAYDNRYYTITSSVNKVELDIDDLYNDDFKSVHKDIIKFISERNSGLIILHGEKGSGKSSYIRALTSNYPNEYIVVTNAVASHLANPEFISFMIEHKNSIFILEDCEQILMERSENTFGGAIANILNMTDGLMSDIFNVKFICTFNADVEKIDSALLRKGRCFANYEFKKLCAEKVEKLAEKNNIHLNEIKAMTLADLFNYNDTSCEVKQPVKKKIGF